MSGSVCNKSKWVVALSLVCLIHGTTHAQLTTFHKVADTDTVIPGGTGNFTAFPTLDMPQNVALENGDVAFTGAGLDGQIGIYTEIGGVLSLVADTNTPIPGGTGNFEGFSSVRTRSTAPAGPSIGLGNVAFIGTGSGGQVGVYTNLGGSLRVVADINTPVTGSTGFFANFDYASTDGVNISFLGIDGSSQTGVYAEIGGTLVVIADSNTAAPGGSGNFGFFEGTSIDAGNVVFFGFAPGRLGIFTNIAGTLGLVADTNTPLVGGSGNFAGFGISPSISGNNSVFLALNSMVQLSVYSDIGGSLGVIADGNTALPGGLGNFNPGIFGQPASIDGDNVVFQAAATGSFTFGLFAWLEGSLIKIVTNDDSIDGKDVTALDPRAGRGEGLSGNQIAFLAKFSDDTQGIFVATVPLDVCGNGILEAGEECDDAGESAECDADCSFAECGDGTINATRLEDCDDGTANSDTAPDACRTDCSLASCGDGTIDTSESCDDGINNSNSTPNACRTNCTLPRCGDGTIDSGETCDNGGANSNFTPNACRTNCTPARCGDGVTDSSEGCDDGNLVSGDGCSDTCVNEREGIPTVSSWGVAILTLLLLVVGRLSFNRRLILRG